MTLFELKVGEKFKHESGVHTVRAFYLKRVPTWGRTMVCETVCDNGKTSKWLRDWDVEKVDEPQ